MKLFEDKVVFLRCVDAEMIKAEITFFANV